MQKKVTTVLNGELAEEAERLSARTGFGISDLLRQGLIRLVHEVQRDGGFQSLPLPERAGRAELAEAK